MVEEKYLSIPYKKHGRDRNGADCYGFARIVIEEESGITLPMLNWKDMPDDEVYRQFKPILNPENLSLVFMQGGPFHTAHVGVFLHGYVLHMTEHGACCTPFKRLERYIQGIYTYDNRKA